MENKTRTNDLRRLYSIILKRKFSIKRFRKHNTNIYWIEFDFCGDEIALFNYEIQTFTLTTTLI
jgi:hypothetical protein